MIDNTTTSLQAFGVCLEELTTEIAVYPAETPGRIAIIDADFIAYHIAHLFPKADDILAIELKADELCNHYRMLAGAEIAISHTTMGDNKSHKPMQAIQKPYQWTRQKKEKHPTIETVKRYLNRGGYGWEADDIVSAAAWKYLINGVDCVIVSPDKDLRMIPGKHYNFKTGCIDEHYGYGKLEYKNGKLSGYGTAWFWAQMLMGDRVDGITGLPLINKANGKLSKVGPKTTYDLLKDINTDDGAYDVVANLYNDLEGTYKDYRTDENVHWYDVFMSEANMLWMKRTLRINDFVFWLDGQYENEENRCYSCKESNAQETERSMSAVLATDSC